MSPRRIGIVGTVGLLHVAVIYALINGMAHTAITQIENIIHLTPVPPTTPPKHVVLLPAPTLLKPTTALPLPATAPVPVIKIADEAKLVITTDPPRTDPPPAVPDTAATGIGGTHTTPPYPTTARALSHQGTVVLQMSVSPEGEVTSASVVTSSGFVELDQAAIAWVMSHWKYKPAVQGGSAVASQTRAAVKFDLQQM